MWFSEPKILSLIWSLAPSVLKGQALIWKFFKNNLKEIKQLLLWR